MKTVPILLVSCRRPHYLFSTLDALQKYTEHPIEVFVANNMSSSETREVLGMFVRRGFLNADNIFDFDTNVLYIKGHFIKEMLNVQKKIEGKDYFVLIDDDIIPQRRWLSEMLSIMEDNKDDIVALQPNWAMVDFPDFNNEYVTKQISKHRANMLNKYGSMIESPTSPYEKDDRVLLSAVDGLIVFNVNLFRKMAVPFLRGFIFCIEAQKMGYKTGYTKNIYARHLGANVYCDYPGYAEFRDKYFQSQGHV